ncbi:MAG: hypothetical protein ACRC0L_11675, partial [Angustibacter sp.]
CCVGLLVGQRVLTWTDSDEELRKAITTVLADPAGVIVFDNLTEGTTLASPVLARLVTERTWTDRKLGSNTSANYPNDRLWLATGNNLRTGADMASRTIWVRLDPNCPAPEARTGFTIPHLDTWILNTQNQAAILEHLLILINDWTSHGAPTSATVPAMRQFTKWATHLGGFLTHHRIPGFLDNHQDTNALDTDQETWTGFLTQWHTIFGTKPVTASQLYQSSIDEYDRDPWHGQFLTTTTGGKIRNAKSLGKYLTGNIDRWHGNTVLRSDPPTHGHPRTYTLEHAPHTPPQETPKTPP